MVSDDARATLRFSCTLCGDCCSGQQTVRLTGSDLSLLAQWHGLGHPRELKALGRVSWVREPVGAGHFAWRPRLRFRTHPGPQCAYLVNKVNEAGVYHGLCALHPDSKPLVCRLSPLMREVEDGGREVLETWSAVPPVVGCPGFGVGEELVLAPPSQLVRRLADEVAWMRFLIAETPGCPDAESAWSLVDRWTFKP